MSDEEKKVGGELPPDAVGQGDRLDEGAVTEEEESRLEEESEPEE